MNFKTWGFALLAMLLISVPCLADSGAGYIPATNCDVTNFTSLSSATEVAPFDSTAVETRITVDNSGAAPVRCTVGNIYGTTPVKPTVLSGYEVYSTPFDFYPYVPPSGDTWCIEESGSPKVSVLRCHR